MANPQNVFLARIGNIRVNDDLKAGIPFGKGFYLTNNHDAFFGQMGAALRVSLGQGLGLHEEVMLRRSPLLAYSFDEQFGIFDESELNVAVPRVLAALECLLNCLWLFKDHAAHLVRGAVVYEQKPCFVLTQPITSSKCDGSADATSFRGIHVESALELSDFVFPLQAVAPREHEKELVHPGNSRLSRALHFVANARQTTSLAFKIASHCSALESLLRLHGCENMVRFRLGKRVAALLVADSPEYESRVESQVKEMYAVRSTLFHGQLLDRRGINKLSSTANIADDIVRAINTIAKLNDSGLLFLVLERFKNLDLHPDKVSNLEMGYVFEELVRKFNEAMDENPGEHFTPREVIRLMVNLLLSRDKETLAQNHIVRTAYDPCCGSGGMLTIAKDRIFEMNPNAEVHLFGQEVNPETFAVCKSDLYLKSSDGRDAENIKFGSTLSNDQHAGTRFDYLLTNPPYGKEWKMDQAVVETEADRGYAGRFGAGLPRISDGQLLFLQHLLCRMKDPKDGGSRVAIVMNGSPLFTGDAGGGESEIRRWILENDWLETIVALPEQLFYNTGIPTYVWVLTNRKPRNRKNKVQLIDATSFWVPMRKSLGNKRREISSEQIQQITKIFEGFKEGENSKIFATEDFGYRKVTVERPLRLNFQASPERVERLKQEKAFLNLATSKKKGKDQKKDVQAGEELQGCILTALGQLDAKKVWKSRPEFEKALDKAFSKSEVKVPAAVRKAILAALSERDETADICADNEGCPEADPELRDTENVPLAEDVQEFFMREVKPHVPDAWVNVAVRDHKNKEVGKVGYEINFNRYFYQYQPPRPLEDIEADIRDLEKDIVTMLREVAG